MRDQRGTALLGVDLGTSNTVAVVRRPDGTIRPLLFDGSPVTPSAIWLDDNGDLHTGRDAMRMSALQPDRYEPNPKRRIDEGSLLLGQTSVPVVDALGVILTGIARKTHETVGHLPPAVFTYPASWGSPRQRILEEAVIRAGFQRRTFVPEPIAAARYYADVLDYRFPVGKAVTVVDFGGGTLDLAVVRRDVEGYSVTGYGGLDDLGGVDLDAVVAEILGETLRQRHSETWERMRTPSSLTDRRMRRAFWEDIRAAKEMLSRTTSAPIPVPGSDDTIHITREEFDRAARALLVRGVVEARKVIARARVQREDVVALFLVGGASQTPLLARELHASLGIAATVLEQPELPVAEGAIRALEPPHPAASCAPAARPRPTPGNPPEGQPARGTPTATSPTGGAPTEIQEPEIEAASVLTASTSASAEPSPHGEHSTTSYDINIPVSASPDKRAPLGSTQPRPTSGSGVRETPYVPQGPPPRKISFTAPVKYWVGILLGLPGIVLAICGITGFMAAPPTPEWILITNGMVVVGLAPILIWVISAVRRRASGKLVVRPHGIEFHRRGRPSTLSWDGIDYWLVTTTSGQVVAPGADVRGLPSWDRRDLAFRFYPLAGQHHGARPFGEFWEPNVDTWMIRRTPLLGRQIGAFEHALMHYRRDKRN